MSSPDRAPVVGVIRRTRPTVVLTHDPWRRYRLHPDHRAAGFLVLDSNAYSFALTDQTVWIEQQLQAARLDPEIKHIFVSMHHPPYSISLHGGQAELREAWTPLFEEYGVAAVFSGHDHVYSRAEKNGVHYFVSGGRFLNFVAVSEQAAWERESWTDRGSIDDARRCYAGWHPQVHAILDHAALP